MIAAAPSWGRPPSTIPCSSRDRSCEFSIKVAAYLRGVSTGCQRASSRPVKRSRGLVERLRTSNSHRDLPSHIPTWRFQSRETFQCSRLLAAGLASSGLITNFGESWRLGALVGQAGVRVPQHHHLLLLPRRNAAKCKAFDRSDCAMSLRSQTTSRSPLKQDDGRTCRAAVSFAPLSCSVSMRTCVQVSKGLRGIHAKRRRSRLTVC
jgi:hypothetical protein